MSKEILSFSEAEIKAIAKFLYCFDAECAESEDEWIVTLWKWGGDFIQCQGTDIPSALASAMHSAGCHITTDCNLPTYKPATDPATIEQGLKEGWIQRRADQ